MVSGNPYAGDKKCYTDKCVKNTLKYMNEHPSTDAQKSNKQVRVCVRACACAPSSLTSPCM